LLILKTNLIQIIKTQIINAGEDFTN